MAQGIGNFIDRVQLGDDEAHQIAIGSSAYGVCSSLGNTVEKVVSLPGFTLNPGTTIHIKFNHTNLATSPTLNVNNTGAKPIVKYNTEAVNSWFDGAVLTLTYDGTSWVIDQDTNTTYTISPSLTNGKIRIISSVNEDYEVSVPGLAALAYKSELLESDIPDLSWTKITTGVPTTLSGYGITDASINSNGTITLGSETITPIVSVNGHTGSSISVTAADLGLSNAMHFIGVTSTPLADGSITATLTAASTNSLSKTTGFINGDVVIDGDQLREYVWSNGAWILLGFTASNIYDSDNTNNPSSSDEPTWISRVQQATDGTISIERQTIGTLGVEHGGTGKSEWTQWGIIYASATNTLAQVTAGSLNNINQPLISGGPATPKWYAGLTLTGDGTQQSPYDATFNNTVTITGAATLSSTLSVTGNSTLTGKVGIGASSNDNYQLYVNGVSFFNGNTFINGNLIPGANNKYNLGSSDSNNRWAKLYIGNADSHGDAYTPIYWNDGVPKAVTPVQYCEFTIQNGKTGIRLTHDAFTENSYVLQIVVTSGESNLNSAINWESSAEGYIDLTCSATSGDIQGYILVSGGGTLPKSKVKSEDLPLAEET